MASRSPCCPLAGRQGQIAVMHRILVEEKRWIGEQRFLHALNFCMLLPGPEAQQLATYIGWLMHRTRGGIVAGTLFVLPGMVSIMALSWIYASSMGELGIVSALFFGLKAAVLAIVLHAVHRIGKRALRSMATRGSRRSRSSRSSSRGAVSAVVLAAGAIGYAAGRSGSRASTQVSAMARSGRIRPMAIPCSARNCRRTPAHRIGRFCGDALACLVLWLAPVLALLLLLGPDNVFTRIATFFSAMATVSFGGAYAVLAYVAQEAVQSIIGSARARCSTASAWPRRTPGPLIMVLQFVGFLGAYRNPGLLSPLLAGTLGGLLATWVTFVPCFLWIFLGAPFIERMRGNRALAGALAAVTAAVVGVVLNLAVWFAIHTLFRETWKLRAGPLAFDVPVLGSIDVPAALLALAVAIAMFRFRLGMISARSPPPRWPASRSI